MSRTYSILCKDCKESIWVAQGWPSRPTGKTFYHGDHEIMVALGAFLFRHEDHNLTFTDDEKIDDDVNQV